MASSGLSPRLRSASSAKSIIMIAFFLAMPISRITPSSAIRLNSEPVAISADPGRGQRCEDRDRTDIALVEHAEHDIDGEQCRSNQQGLMCERSLKRPGRPLESA